MVVTDKGPGGADPSGAGLVGLADRVEAAGGTVELTSTVAGTKVSRASAGYGETLAGAGFSRIRRCIGIPRFEDMKKSIIPALAAVLAATAACTGAPGQPVGSTHRTRHAQVRVGSGAR